jgi:hypothetical protein
MVNLYGVKLIGGLLATTRTLFGLRGFTSALVPSSTSRSNNSSVSRQQRPRRTTALYDFLTDVEAGRQDLIWYDEVDSTMDQAKALLKQPDFMQRDAFAVVAGRQTAGRGTHGRTWMSSDGNLFMTMVFKLSMIRIPLTLVPLRMGTLIIPSIKSRVLPGGPPVQLKWPNDVLIGEKKICGILIEVDQDRVVVGIGCNVQHAPAVESSGQQYGRLATCLAEHQVSSGDGSSSGNNGNSTSTSGGGDSSSRSCGDDQDPNVDTCSAEQEQLLDPNTHKEIAAEIFTALSAWLRPHTVADADTADAVIRDFERDMDMDLQRLRGETGPGETIIPLRLNRDGTLRVRIVGGLSGGEERTIVADYLL